MSIRKLTLSAAALALALPGAAFAKAENHAAHQSGKAHAGHGKTVTTTRTVKRVSTGKRYAGQACPPGLGKKYPGCIPPGQWRKGNRVPQGWSTYYVRYDRLPDYYRNRYDMNPGYRYMYQDGRVLVIDAVTRAIVDIFVR
jgi:hypothetical protein